MCTVLRLFVHEVDSCAMPFSVPWPTMLSWEDWNTDENTTKRKTLITHSYNNIDDEKSEEGRM